MSCPSETRLQAFVEGELAPAQITELSAHLDACVECRMVVGNVEPFRLDDDRVADRIGRYVLRRVLGRGGMGVVYEAVDPDLHRPVALKVLRSDLGAMQTRLLAEAEAMAKLSHPNVVTIHDVGRADGRVFIVMALVDGVSLRHWLAREARGMAAVLDAFLQAASGLRAAHDAGLVHRDFKPENVFVARDGRVQVGDFGLAAALDGDANAGEGSVAYMAPEQRSGRKVDARSDQFSFCVALSEALEGVRTAGWLRAVLARGTKTEPDARYPSMEALVAALESGRRRGKRRRFAALAALAAAALTALTVGVVGPRRGPPPALCRSGDAQAAEVWNGDVARRVEHAFRGTESPLWEGAWRKTDAVLGTYTEAWRGALRRTCGAARGDRDAAVVDRRASCLSERIEILRAVVGSLEHADAPMLEQVPTMLHLLPRVNACEDPREIAQLAPLPAAEKRAAVDAARRKIASASATVAAGRYAEGLAVAEEALQAAGGASYLPLLAEAYLSVGTAHGRLGHALESEQALEHAVSSASAGQAPALAVRAWIQLMHFVGFEGKRYDDGHRYADYAKAALESLPGAFELEVERLSWSRAMLLDQKRFDEALAVSREELAVVEVRFGGLHRLSAVALDGLAGVLVGQCKMHDAIEPQERSCAILEKEFGLPHPQLALCLGNLAALHANLGDHARAIGIKERALSMFERVPGHPNHVAMARRNMVRSLLEVGRLEDARGQLEAAAALGKRESEQTTVLVLRGELLRRSGRPAEAAEDHLLAVARTATGEPLRRLEPLTALAETHLAAERFTDAATMAGHASELARQVYGPRSCRIAEPLRLHASALVGSGRAREARPIAERALAALEGAQLDPLARARAELALATALPPEDRERARVLAGSARETAVREARDPGLVRAVDRYLAAVAGRR